MKAFIGLDVGTSAIKGVLVTETGRQIARAVRQVRFLYPEPGYVEIDPEEHCSSVCDVIRELTAQAQPPVAVLPEASRV